MEPQVSMQAVEQVIRRLSDEHIRDMIIIEQLKIELTQLQITVNKLQEQIGDTNGNSDPTPKPE